MNKLLASLGASLMAVTEVFFITASVVAIVFFSDKPLLTYGLYAAAAVSIATAIWVFTKVWAKESLWQAEDAKTTV